MEQERAKISSNQIKNMKLTLELLTEDLDKTKRSLEQLKRICSVPLDLGAEHNPVDFIDKLYTLTKRTEDNYQRMDLRIDNLSEKVNELEQAVSESYNSINERFNFWLHDIANNKSKSVDFLDFPRLIKSNGLTYAYFLNRLVNDNSILICKPVPSGINRSDFVSNQSLAYSTYVKDSEKWLKPLRKIGHKLFKKPNKWVYHLFSSPRKAKKFGTFKGKDNIELKEYLPFKYDDPDQILKILYDFINMHGISGRDCANLITAQEVFALFMSEQPFIMKDHQVEFTRTISGKKGRQSSEIIVFK